jgi:hypothetical protein
LWLIFAALRRRLNLEKFCQRNTASSAERIETAEPRRIWKNPKDGAK